MTWWLFDHARNDTQISHPGGAQDSKKEYWLNAIASDQLYVSDLKAWSNEAACLYGVNGVPQNFLLVRRVR